jgi:hypothetical protein
VSKGRLTLIQKLRDGPTLVSPAPYVPENKLSDNVTPIDKPPPSEKRREARYPCNDAVAVRILSVGPRHFPATVLDVSRSGLRLELAIPIAKGSEIEVTARSQIVIFGEVRYCRRAGDSFHAGVLIRDVIQSRLYTTKHLHDDELSLYLVGKGLTMPEVIRVKAHLATCEECHTRLSVAYAVLHPTRRRKLFAPTEALGLG